VKRIVFVLSLLTLCAVGCGGSAVTPETIPAPGVVLQKILSECWGVTQLKELDGTRADQTRAFECARQRLLDMTRTYPDAPEPHRLLAWGYYFSLQDEDAARAEYERAAEIYASNAHPGEQAEMLVQLASLALKYDRGNGCSLLQQAARIDPANARAAQLLRNFGCFSSPTPSRTPGPPNGQGAANFASSTKSAPSATFKRSSVAVSYQPTRKE
jgi:hypothetical protein